MDNTACMSTACTSNANFSDFHETERAEKFTTQYEMHCDVSIHLQSELVFVKLSLCML